MLLTMCVQEILRFVPGITEAHINVVLTGKDSVGQFVNIVPYDLAVRMVEYVVSGEVY